MKLTEAGRQYIASQMEGFETAMLDASIPPQFQGMVKGMLNSPMFKADMARMREGATTDIIHIVETILASPDYHVDD